MEEAQEEERDVLRSIYDGDENFKEINPCCFQYKYGNEATENKAFLLEISWPKEYPSELPTINLDTFFNKCLPSCLKDEIKSKLLVQAEELRDSPMTYSLIDWLNENSEEFISKIPDDIPIKVERIVLSNDITKLYYSEIEKHFAKLWSIRKCCISTNLQFSSVQFHHFKIPLHAIYKNITATCQMKNLLADLLLYFVTTN